MININSKTIEEFIKLIDYCKKNIDIELKNEEEFNNKEKDLLHILELEKLTSSQESRIKTCLKRNRKERRICKNNIGLMRPIVKFADENRAFINKLNTLLGDVRQTERRYAGKPYIRKYDWGI